MTTATPTAIAKSSVTLRIPIDFGPGRGSELVTVRSFKGKFQVVYYGAMAMGMAEALSIHSTQSAAEDSARRFAATRMPKPV